MSNKNGLIVWVGASAAARFVVRWRFTLFQESEAHFLDQVLKKKGRQTSGTEGRCGKFAGVVIIGLPRESKWVAIHRNGRGQVAIQCDRGLAPG